MIAQENKGKGVAFMQHSEREYEEMRQELLSSKRKYESYSKELACKLLQEDGFVEVIKNRAIFRQVKYMDQSLELKGRVEKAFCFWDFIPVRIVPRRKPKDVSYKKFVFVYFMHVEKNDIKSDQRDAYTLRIVTAWDGTLLQKSFFKGEFPKDFPCKFAYPKRIVAKINQCLMNNFFLDLWEGPRYAAWYHTEAGLATFMGTLELEATSSIGALQSLLEAVFTRG